jgi:hypothetical protein
MHALESGARKYRTRPRPSRAPRARGARGGDLSVPDGCSFPEPRSTTATGRARA